VGREDVRCSVLQRVAACCSLVQCVKKSIESEGLDEEDCRKRRCMLQCVAVCCSVLQCVAVCCSVLQCAAVCCSALQCVEERIGTKRVGRVGS